MENNHFHHISFLIQLFTNVSQLLLITITRYRVSSCVLKCHVIQLAFFN